MIEQDGQKNKTSNTVTLSKSLDNCVIGETGVNDINAQRKDAELYVKLHIANHRPG